jgi:hypothetical protein
MHGTALAGSQRSSGRRCCRTRSLENRLTWNRASGRRPAVCRRMLPCRLLRRSLIDGARTGLRRDHASRGPRRRRRRRRCSRFGRLSFRRGSGRSFRRRRSCWNWGTCRWQSDHHFFWRWRRRRGSGCRWRCGGRNRFRSRRRWRRSNRRRDRWTAHRRRDRRRRRCGFRRDRRLGGRRSSSRTRRYRRNWARRRLGRTRCRTRRCRTRRCRTRRCRMYLLLDYFQNVARLRDVRQVELGANLIRGRPAGTRLPACRRFSVRAEMLPHLLRFIRFD